MLKAKSATMVGLALVLLGFALGTSRFSASLEDTKVSCHSVINLSAIPFAETAPKTARSMQPLGPLERRIEEACEERMSPVQLLTWGALGLGALLSLIGWIALREAAASTLAQRGVVAHPTANPAKS